jgi:polyisoprenoid-binding protein YceI
VRLVAGANATYAIGPETGALTVHTGRAGVGAAVGHDLVLEVTAWNGTVELDADQPDSCSVRVTVDPRSFEVRAARGGVKPLTASDRNEIRRNIDKVLAPNRIPSISFRSTAAIVAGEHLSVDGELTLGRRTCSTRLDGVIGGEPGETTITARTTVVQSALGIKPYSALMGALRVRDAVEIHVVVRLPLER